MDGHRRYAEDPEPPWYPGRTPYDSGPSDRPDDGFGAAEPGPGDRARYLPTGNLDPVPTAPPYPATERYPGPDAYPVAPAAYPPTDPLTTTGGFRHGAGAAGSTGGRPELDAIRVPLRPTEYPPVRPGGVPPAAEPAGPGETHGGTGRPGGAPARSAGPSGQPGGPAYDQPTSFVPPIGGRIGDGAEARLPGDHPGRAGDRLYRTGRPASAVGVAAVTALLMVPVIRLLLHVSLGTPAARGVVPAVLLTLGLPLTGLGLYGVAVGGRAPDRSTWLRPPVGYLPVGLILVLAAAIATS